MKRVLSTIFAIIACFVMGIAVLPAAWCGDSDPTGKERISSMTGIEMPSGLSVMYHYIQEKGFGPGCAAQYSVYKFESDQTEWFIKNSFRKGRNGEFERNMKISMNMISDINKIPDEYCPGFGDEYYYLMKNGVELLYKSINRMLFVSIAPS